MQLTIKNASSALLFCVYKHVPKKREYMCIYMVFFHFVLKVFDNAFEQSLGVFRFQTSGLCDNNKHQTTVT